MKLNTFNPAERPVIAVRNKNLVPEKIDFKDLEGVGAPRGAYGLNVGETIEFPETEADIELMAIPLRENGAKQIVVLVLKNGKQAWFGLSNLRRMDCNLNPVHPVAAQLREAIQKQALPNDDKTRLKLVLGKRITATESVCYNETVFDNGVPTNDAHEVWTAKLEFDE